MRRIGTPTGLFKDINTYTGTGGTTITASWLNAIQEEICNLIIAAGLTIDPDSTTQLTESLNLLIESKAVNADWNATFGGAKILNKPSYFPPTVHAHNAADIVTDSTHRFITDSEKSILSSGGFETSGTAASLVATHEAKSDPHPVYTTSTELSNALSGYSQTNHTHSNQYEPANSNIQLHIASASNPHNTTATQVGFNATGNLSATNVQAAIAELDTEKQPLDATLTALASISTSANKMFYATGSDTFSTTTLTAIARSLLDDADVETMRTTLGAAASTGKLSQFASTTSSELAGIISDKTGTGSLVFNTSPSFSGTPYTPQLRVGESTTYGWSGVSAVDVNTKGAVLGTTGAIGLSYNVYFDGTVYRYKTTDAINQLYQSTSGLYFRTLASGNAGDAVGTWKNIFGIGMTNGCSVFGTSTLLDNVNTLQVLGGMTVQGATEDNQTIGSAVTSRLKITNTYAAAYGRLSELQFAAGGGYAYQITACISSAYRAYDATNGIGGDLLFSTKYATTDVAPLERMRITQRGNVLIGTTTEDTAYKLLVNGGVKFNYSQGGTYGIALDGTTKTLTGSTCFVGISVPTPTIHDANASYVGMWPQVKPLIPTGVTNGNYVYGCATNALRNYVAADSDDNGTLSTLVAQSIVFGHGNTNTSATPITTTAKGINIKPYAYYGTITSMYGLFIDSPSGSGTITNKWGVYQIDSAFRNYFGGSVLIGTNTEVTAYKLYSISNKTDSSSYGVTGAGNMVLTVGAGYNMVGVYGQATQITTPAGVTGSGMIAGVQGIGYVDTANHLGTIQNSHGVKAYAGINNCGFGGVVTNAFGLWGYVQNANANGTITNAYGCYIDNSQTTGTITNRWGFYQVGASARNYFAGRTLMGTTSDDGTNMLQVSGNIAVTGSLICDKSANTGTAITAVSKSDTATMSIYAFGSGATGEWTGRAGIYMSTSATNSSFTIWQGGVPRFHVAHSTGNVIISNSPVDDGTNKLQVAGPVKFSSTGNTQFTMSGANASTGGTVAQIVFSQDTDSIASINATNAGALDAGHLTFATQTTGGTNTERVRITSNGNTLFGTTTESLTTGNAKIQSSNGVYLGNTANSAANVLDWYEEGTFTPVVAGSGTAGAGTYTAQAGFYTRIGREVIFRLYVAWSAHTGIGGIRITGLPFSSNSTANSHSAFAVNYSAITIGSGKQAVAYIAPSTSTILVQAADPTGAAIGEVNAGTFDTTATYLMISGSYMVA
jgi:hypothetical protein